MLCTLRPRGLIHSVCAIGLWVPKDLPVLLNVARETGPGVRRGRAYAVAFRLAASDLHAKKLLDADPDFRNAYDTDAEVKAEVLKAQPDRTEPLPAIVIRRYLRI